MARRRSSMVLQVDFDQVERLSNTTSFDVLEYLVTRRDTTFPVWLKNSSSGSTVQSVTLDHETAGKQVKLNVVDISSQINTTIIKVHIPSNAPVTVYTLNVKGEYDDGECFNIALQQKVVVLFNAWSSDDPVYMENHKQREEYVLNSQGRLYIGDTSGTPWNLALYRQDSFRSTLFLLENVSNLTFHQKKDPVQVAREMSALINVQDENGVLVGRWDGNYSDGRNPTFWRGSGEILQQYYRSKGTPVKYGQCWVFSGVLLTVLRILGIPSRSVTNFNSAYDTNGNMTIERYYDESYCEVDNLSSSGDSIWYFHVWNEVWMSRPDLCEGFGGWQAVDATPLEESLQGGGYRIGPAPVKAIKDGDSVNFDTGFVFAEVNADIKKYIIERGIPRLFDVDKTTVGKNISTKAVGSYEREDITDQYKYVDESNLRRHARYHGYTELSKTVHDVVFEIPEYSFEFGESVKFQVKISNKGNHHQIKGRIICDVVLYTGRVLKEVLTQEVDTRVKKDKQGIVVVNIDGGVFSEYPGSKVYLRFDVVMGVEGTSQLFAKKVFVAPTPPKLKIECPDKVGLGKRAEMVAVFKNSLPVEMANVTLNIESNELLMEDIVHNIGSIAPGAELFYPFTAVGVKLGSHELVVGMESDKMELVTGKKEVEVLKGVQPEMSVSLGALDISTVDKNIQNNRTEHHTDRYEYDGLVIRRGQKFDLTLTSSKSLSGVMVKTRAVFELLSYDGAKQSRPYEFTVDDTISKTEGTRIKLELKTPSDAVIGKYRLKLTVDKDGKVTVVKDNIELVILFNPWCSDDQCHYPETTDLDEYVLNSSGQIWRKYKRMKSWEFAQFTNDCLDVALWILDKLSPSTSRGKVVKVARHLSAMMNNEDLDKGLLVGKWNEPYTDGTAPLTWKGSTKILTEFNRTKKEVKYAQCWVYSGVLTSIMRCLGLPSRSVSNYASAHEYWMMSGKYTGIVKLKYDKYERRVPYTGKIWDFHVWNEAWMSRPKLPEGYGGWQAVDGTPQEMSQGKVRLGPTPVRAVKNGNVGLEYDVKFVMSEVNAEIHYLTSDGMTTRKDTTSVGKEIITKAVNSDEKCDITDLYKSKDETLSKAADLLASARPSNQALGIELKLDDTIQIGDDFIVRAVVTNNSSNTRDIKVTIRGNTMIYTGDIGLLVKERLETITLKKGETTTLEMPVCDVDYLRIIEGDNYMHFVATAYSIVDKSSAIDTCNISLNTPDIVIELPSEGLQLYHPATVKVSFTNPLKKTLTSGKFILSGESLLQDTTKKIPSVAGNGLVSAELEAICVKQGTFILNVEFMSDQLTDISGDINIKVE